jgi:hypothetical protein
MSKKRGCGIEKGRKSRIKRSQLPTKRSKRSSKKEFCDSGKSILHEVRSKRNSIYLDVFGEKSE